MKKIIFLFFTFFMLFMLGAKAQEIESRSSRGWTGFITWVMTTNTSSGRNSSQDEWRIEVKFNEDGVSAYASETFSRKGPDCKDNRTGKQEGTMTLSHTDFTLEKINGRLFFGIDMGMPFLKGTATECGKTENISQGDLALIIEELNVGSNPEYLSGDSTSIENRNDGTNSSKEEVRIIVQLSRGEIPVELLVMPDNYDQWLPLPGRHQKEAGAGLDIQLKLQARGGGEPLIKASYFEVELQETSKEPGMAINFPVNGITNDFDLAFQPYVNNGVFNGGQQQRLEAVNGQIASLMINSFDGGAYGKLVAYAILKNGKRIKGELFKAGGSSDILIPKRKEGSKIGEAWAIKYGHPADNEDQDRSNGNNNDGDGLTAYEEYRGVFSEGKFRRLDPRKKELGVQLLNEQDKSEFAEGIKILNNAAGIKVIKLDKDELPASRLFNQNSGTVKNHSQYALVLLSGKIDNKVSGINRPAHILEKTPRKSIHVVIDLEQLQSHYQRQDSAFKNGGTKIAYTLKENISVTVAHELGHGIHLDHHGPNTNEVTRSSEYETIPFIVYSMDNVEYIKRPITINKPIGIRGNDASGDLSCIMAYNSAYEWVMEKTPAYFIYRNIPPLPVGKTLCTSNKGTGINADGKFFGDGNKGNCLSQMIIKDGAGN